MQQRQTKLFPMDEEITDAEESALWELPNLTGVSKLSLDTETTGLKLWKGDVPVGLSIATEDGHSWYIPWAHQSGFNFELDNVRSWAKDHLQGKELLLTNAKFDINMLKHVGIDLEELGCKPREVMHLPALLYSTRKDYDLNTMATEFLGKTKIEIGDMAKFPIHERNSAAVSWYAKYDALLTMELDQALSPRIAQENLTVVRDLEDSILFCVAAMEREGAILDVDKLEQWQKQCQARYIQCVMEIYRLTGFRVEPTKSKDMTKLFNHLKIQSGSYAVDQIEHFPQPEVKLAIEAKQLFSLKTKYLDKYMKAVGSDNKIHYALNQLKASNEEGSKGTVTGRFSSSGGGRGIDGINIQQVFDDEKQEKIPCIRDFPIRDLFIPADGFQWLSADARQIEFRIFAHYSNSERLHKAYKTDPLVDFHSFVAKEILHVPRDKKLKNMNFGKIYGMGVHKLATVYLKMPVEDVKPINAHYDREFPEAKILMQQAMDAAKSKGYVHTLLGRRRRYTDEDMRYNAEKGISEMPWWSALNAVIQGSAADVMKRKLKELYASRKETGLNMRFTVHDEVDGDIPNQESALKVHEILSHQTTEMRVPILWKTEIGKSWKDLNEI